MTLLYFCSYSLEAGLKSSLIAGENVLSWLRGNEVSGIIGLTLLILCWSLLWIIIFSRKGKHRLKGGEISLPKKFWLSFAMFVYYPFPVYLMAIHGFDTMLVALWSFFLIRAIVQGLGMYLFKNWSPKSGVAFNLITPLLVLAVAIIDTPMQKEILAYAILVAACTLADAYYAYQFWKIIGEKSKGDNPVWFASDAEEFSQINKLTAFMNVLLYGLFLYSYYWEIIS